MNSPIEILKQIKQISEADEQVYEGLKSMLYDNLFSKIPVIVNKIPIGEILFRAVKIFRNDTTMGRKKYLSYRPSTISYPDFNRCSEPQQTHFYCSNNRHLSLAEVSYFLSKAEEQNPTFEKESEQLEVGMWVVMKDLYVADLRFGSHVEDESSTHVSEVKEHYRNFSDESYVNEFFEYINKTFEIPIKKNENLKYWLTACYSNYLFDDEFKPQTNWGTMDELESITSMPLDGILYRSVKGIATNYSLKGYNFALKTATVDSNSLKLIKAGIFETRQTGPKDFLMDDLIKINTEISSDSWYYRDPTNEDITSPR
jgi:hypothetical protein